MMQYIGHPDRHLSIYSDHVCVEIFPHHDIWILCCRVEIYILDDSMNCPFLLSDLNQYLLPIILNWSIYQN